jgi:transposase
MAGKRKKMSTIKQLLLMHQHGRGKKTIARALGMSKTTVKSYLHKLSLQKESIEELLKLDDPVLEARFHAGNPAYSDNRFDQMSENLEYYADELKRTGVTRKLLWDEYREKNQRGYSYAQFCFHLGQHLKNKTPTMVLQHNPGEKLFVDFAGKTMSYVDKDTGEIKKGQVFVACLPYSDYGFAVVVPSQQSGDFLYALGACLRYLGGVPLIVVPDNLKSAVTKADRYEPVINNLMEEFATHYKMEVMPTRARKPKDKAMVERHVNLVYTHVFARLRNHQLMDLTSLNKAVLERINDHNQTRMQRKPYSRQECFLSEEKPRLSPLPVTEYQVKTYRKYTIAQNNFIFLSQDKKYYSAPYIYTGKKVDVIYSRSLVKIYYQGEVIAQHFRCYDPKRLYVYEENHLCSSHKKYLERSPEYYITRAGYLSKNLKLMIEKKFDTTLPPEIMYRSCDGLLRLAKETDSEIFEKACGIALEHGNYSHKHLQNIIKYKTYEEQPEQGKKPLPTHENIRGKGYYAQQNLFNN